MAKYHYNIYPISADDFSSARALLKDYFSEVDPKFPCPYGDAFSDAELKLIVRCLPENITYMVRRSLDGYKVMYSVWILPTFTATNAIECLINNGLIVTNIASRDVSYYDFKSVINDLPYNYHYIVQRYYE